MANDRLHEIIAQIGVIHSDLVSNNKIQNINEVEEYIKDYEKDVKEHYFNLLMQYYYQQDNLENLKYLLLKGYRFELQINDIKEAFFKISSDENVILFLEDDVLYLKDKNIGVSLKEMYDYYNKNLDKKNILDNCVNLMKRNRYICVYASLNKEKDFARFFLNEDVEESLKRDLPHMFRV